MNSSPTENSNMELLVMGSLFMSGGRATHTARLMVGASIRSSSPYTEISPTSTKLAHNRGDSVHSLATSSTARLSLVWLPAEVLVDFIAATSCCGPSALMQQRSKQVTLLRTGTVI